MESNCCGKVSLALSVLAIIGTLYFKFGNSGDQAVIDDDKIKAVALQAVRENPKVIVDAMGEGINQKRVETIQQISEGIIQNKDEISRMSLKFGPKDAKSKIVCFFDPLCPHCIEFQKSMIKLLEAKKSVEFQMMPVVIVGEDSVLIARLYTLIYKKSPEKALEFIGKITNEKTVDQKTIEKAVKSIGLDYKELEASSTDADKVLLEVGQLANKLNIPVVPAAFIVKGSKAEPLQSFLIEDLAAVIDDGIPSSEPAPEAPVDSQKK